MTEQELLQRAARTAQEWVDVALDSAWDEAWHMYHRDGGELDQLAFGVNVAYQMLAAVERRIIGQRRLDHDSPQA